MVRRGFDWRQSSVRLDDVNAVFRPRVRTSEPYRVRLKRVVWGTVQVNSGTVCCWCECNRTRSRKWTAINAVLFDKNVCLCVFHSLSWVWRVWLMRYKQKAVGLISVHLQRSLEHLQFIRKTDISAVMYWSFVNKMNGSKTSIYKRAENTLLLLLRHRY